MRIPDCNRAMLIPLTILVALAAAVNAQPVVDPTDLDLDGEPGVAEAPAIAHEQIPSVLIGVGSILVDHAHWNDFDVSGFTDYLASQGWTIAEHPVGPITESILAGRDILIVPTRSDTGPTRPFATAEIAAIQAFLAAGGGLWMLNDNQDAGGLNTLATQFGVEFLFDYVRDPSDNEGELFWPTIYLLTPHAMTANVETYGYYLGDCLVVNPPAQVVATADEDAWTPYCPAGTFPPVLAVWENVGRAVFSGDGTPLHPYYYPEKLRDEEQLLLQNIANWLLGDPPNATSDASWGGLKRRFPIGEH